MHNRASSMLVIAVFLLLYTGCGKTGTAQKQDARLRVIATFLPLQVFAANVIGDREGIQLDRLLPASGIDPHNYSLSPKDAERLINADIIIVNGMGFEVGLDDILKEAAKNATVITASNGIEPIHLTDRDEPNGQAPRSDINPHCWVSPKEAIVMVENIRDGLISADPTGKDVYTKNAEAYIGKLITIDNEIHIMVDDAATKEIITFHNAFAYFARDYGIDVIRVIEIHPGQEPSAGEISDIIELATGYRLKAIFAEPQYPRDVADLIAKEAGLKVLILDPYHTGVYALDGYEKAWRANIANLVEGLN